MKKNLNVELKDIESARETIKDVIRPTEVEFSQSSSSLVDADVYIKLENNQFTGSFKLRGAYNKIMQLTPEEKKRGVIASSAGNHAQGVAFSAQKAGIKSLIVMPTRAPLVKVAATRGYGAEVLQHGEIYDDAFEKAKELEKSQGYIFIPPFEDAAIIAGQGTIGLEVLERIPDLDSIIVPIGGGGLISGIAVAIKSLRPQCKVYGVQSEQAPGMYHLFKKQEIGHLKPATIADGIAVKKPSEAMYETFIKKYVDEIVTVSDDEISEAIVFLIERVKTVTEGSGAAAMAALMKRRNLNLGKKTCVLLSGGNIDLNIVEKVIQRGLIRNGRLTQLQVVVDDLPGQLSRLTKIIAECGGNILEVHHDRMREVSLRETRIEFTIETMGFDHVEDIRRAFEKIGAKVIKNV